MTKIEPKFCRTEYGWPALSVGPRAKHLQAVVLLQLKDDYPFTSSRSTPEDRLVSIAA